MIAQKQCAVATYSRRACGLVRDNLDALDVASGLENLAQNVLGDTGVQASDIQCPLVRLRRSTARGVTSSAGGRHDTTRHG
jgi:hypothetical protein